ncbi:MAG: nucleoid-associated protein [Anaerostipes sp.]|nr:nucleoid-associated protein [Anaerostipes sp.]
MKNKTKIQRDDVIIRKGICHILDRHSGYLGLSTELLDMGPDLMEFVRGHIFKILESDDAKKCELNGSRSQVLSLLEAMDEKDDDSFIEASRTIAENLFDITCDSVLIPSADLIVVSFQLESVVHLALLKMNYKETYVHRESENEGNNIVNQRVIPTGNTRLTEAIIIDLLEYKVQLVEKKYEMLSGDKVDYLSERFLKCHAQMAPKRKFQLLNKVITDISNKYPEGIQNRLDMKSKLREEFFEKQEFRANEIGDKIFGSDPEKKQAFDEKVEQYDIQYDTFTVEKENTVRKLEYQMMETDTGIEIKIPMEEYDTKDNIEIIEDAGGASTIIIKNVEQIRVN